MKHLHFLFILYLAGIHTTWSQQKITLEQIWNGAFQPQMMESVNALQNSNQFSRIETDHNNRSQQINLYDFATLEKTNTIFTTAQHSEISYIGTYSFDKSEEKILVGTNVVPIYRRSFLADYFLYHIQTDELQKIADHPVSEPTFSQKGDRIAYAYKNNLFVYNIADRTTVQITNDGEKNHIINGISDWVYEEEFAVVRMFEWSPEGDKIAYIRFDETEVPEYSMDIYGNELYPTQSIFKYPKAGESNAKVELYIYDLKEQKTYQIDLSEFSDFYIPRIQWTNDNSLLSMQLINRHQNDLKLFFINTKDHTKHLVLNETDHAYIDITDNLTFLKDNSLIWTSEQDGYNHIYHYDKHGKLLNQITKGNWEVTDYYGIDEKNKTIFYQSVENSSTKRDLYSIRLDGKNKKKLSKESGTHAAVFSPDFDLYIHTYSSASTAPRYTLNRSKDGSVIKSILDNSALEAELKSYQLPQKEFIEIPTKNNLNLNAWIMKPKDFDPHKRYPVLMYQYSGPGSQQVADKWWDTNDFWHAMLTQKGYIIVTVDGRGTGFRGASFKKQTQLELGKLETEDQIEAARYLGSLEYVDASRIGIWGWSYGGFMSTNCLLKGNEVFKTAIAVAPVTNWRYYDTIYTERYMKTPQENPSGYDDNSPIFFAAQLKGNYLLIHGSADDNVHVQNSMALIEALVQQNKDFEWLIYPDKNHGIYGGKTRLQLYTKMTNYLLKNL